FGQVNDGSLMTILRAFYSGSPNNQIDLIANEIVVGVHLETSNSTVREATLKFTNLEEWTGRMLVSESTATDNGDVAFVVPSKANPDLELVDLPQLKRLKLTTGLNVSQTRVQTKLTNQSQFDLEFEVPVTLESITQWVRSIGNLLALLVGEPVW